MVFSRAALLSFLITISAGAVHAQSETAGEVFEDWLEAFNSGEEAKIRKFFGERLDDPDAAFALDTAEDTCGFDPVRVESHSSDSISALLVEKCHPALQRLKFDIAPSNDGSLENYSLRPFALPLEAANAVTADVATRLAEQDDFAGSLLIVRDGVPSLGLSWGSLHGADKSPITLDTPMFLASAGKMFTAVAVLQLVDAGDIDLDAPLGKYLTDYPNAEMAQVTIRQLLQHRGGTGDIGVLARDEGANRARIKTIHDLIAFNGNRAPDFPPGSKMEYSNYGFLLLGAVVERISGENYYDYVTRNIFERAGMRNAGFPDLDHLDEVATGYTTFFGEEPDLVSHRDVLPWRGSPAGGGVASANDMLNFLEALSSGKLLSQEKLELATTPGETPWYGMGMVLPNSDNSSWGHGGVSYGMDVAAYRYPPMDTTFVCLATRDMACTRLMNVWARRIDGLIE